MSFDLMSLCRLNVSTEIPGTLILMFANLQLGDKLTTYIYFISLPPPPHQGEGNRWVGASG